MYYILPDFPQHKRQILAGAIIAATLWVIATTIFRLYVINFTTFNKAYGTVGAVLLLLSWMYYSMAVVLAVFPASTVFPPDPGAVVKS